MANQVRYSLDDLRLRSLAYLQETGSESNRFGIRRAETPGGLEIRYAEGWFNLVGALIDYSTGHEVEVRYEIDYNYGEVDSPKVEEQRFDDDYVIKSIPKKRYDQVATELMTLFVDPSDMAMAASG